MLRNTTGENHTPFTRGSVWFDNFYRAVILLRAAASCASPKKRVRAAGNKPR